MDENRVSRLEGAYDALKVVRPMTVTVIGIFLAALVFVLSFLSVQVAGISARLDTTNARLDAQSASLNAKIDAQSARIDAKIDAINVKIDAIPALLATEFRAMRLETAAQTSAIANAITAARQIQTAPPPRQPK